MGGSAVLINILEVLKYFTKVLENIDTKELKIQSMLINMAYQDSFIIGIGTKR